MPKRNMYMVIGGFVLVVLVGMLAGKADQPKPKKDVSYSPEAQTIPYRIIDVQEVPKHKMSYKILVGLANNTLPDEFELAKISNRLHSEDHENTFVEFYLPGMEIGDGAFATAHHNPKLNVIVNDWALPEQYKHLTK